MLSLDRIAPEDVHRVALWQGDLPRHILTEWVSLQALESADGCQDGETIGGRGEARHA